MKLRETKFYKLLSGGCPSDARKACIDFMLSRKCKNIRDCETGETLLHLVCEHLDLFTSARGVGVIYIMVCEGIDLDIQDYNGDSFLHKLMRKPNTFRVVVAALRCGADILIRNNEGKTPEDVLLECKPEGWEETYHWFNKFKPGLYRAMMEPEPDRQLIEKLLKYLCRPIVVKNEKTVCLKTKAKENIRNIDLVYLIEKYENNIEFALAVLTGKDMAVRKYFKNVENAMENIDINLRDCSYQSDLTTPESPRPLLAACWESGSLENVKILLDMGVDPSVMYSYQPGQDPPLPLFFQILDKRLQLSDEIIYTIINSVDLNTRDEKGQTILFHAIQKDFPEKFIDKILKKGINITLRDRYGRTAFDIARKFNKVKCCRKLDDHVLQIVKRGEPSDVEKLVLQNYDRLPDIHDSNGVSIVDYAEDRWSKDLQNLVKNFSKIQTHVQDVFSLVEVGNLSNLRLNIGKKYATSINKCGRNLLHVAVLHKNTNVIKFLLERLPTMLNTQDNLGRTPLHYAMLFLEGDPIIDEMIAHNANTFLKDVLGRTPQQYTRQYLGDREFLVLGKEVNEMATEVFLKLTDFDSSLYKAIRTGDLENLKNLVRDLKKYGDINRYSQVLFECIENGWEPQAVLLIEEGIRTDIYKQYIACDPESVECAMCECSHTVTSFRDRAIQLRRTLVMNALNVPVDKSTVHMYRSPTEISEFSLI